LELNSLIVGLVVGWIMLIVGILISRAVVRWQRMRRYGEPIDHSSLLTDTCRKLTAVNDRGTLEELLTQELPLTLHIRRSVLLLPDDYQLTSMKEQGFQLPVNHAAVRWVASAGEAQRADHGRLQTLIQQGRTDLAWTRVWAPLMRGAELTGMWLLGEREGDRSYSPEDLGWLTSVGREAAGVLQAIQHAEHERMAASEIRALYRQMVTTRENERGRLSRELHDGVLQDLCAVTRDLKALESGPVSVAAPFENLTQRSSEAVDALRAICHDLRPPLLQQDLLSALKALTAEIDARSPAPVHLDIAAQADELHFPDEVALAIFRITQEALNNAVQHADASEIAVRLTQYPDRLRLTVTDDGRGIQGSVDSARFVAQGHFGMAGMRERAAMIGGNLDVQTAVEYGTVVILELPLIYSPLPS
jgi:signal transduction histidine kinase